MKSPFATTRVTSTGTFVAPSTNRDVVDRAAIEKTATVPRTPRIASSPPGSEFSTV